jgi:hypothetical protein
MRRINYILISFLIFVSLLFATVVRAAIIYVDKDTPCPGQGASNNPYCTIQRAFDAVRPGDVIRIRDSALPYDERALGTRSGTATSPITVEPDVGHNPTLRYSGNNAQTGAIEIRDADYWHIKGLTFDGSETQTSRHAVLLYAYSRDITGHRITQNTFRYWGGTGENTKGAAAVMLRPSWGKGFNNFFVKDSVIGENTFAYNAMESIHLTKTANIVVERNSIQYSQCGRGTDNTAGATGIKDSQGSVGTIIRNNIIRDHQMSADCLLPDQGHATYAGIYCDTGPTGGEIGGNVIYNIDKGQISNTNSRAKGVSSQGIIIESRCHDWRVHDNIVYNVGTYGLRNGSGNTGDPNRTIWANNTVFGIGRTALWIARGSNLVIKNNILVHNRANAAIELTNTAVNQGPHTIDHNLYWDMSDGSRVGRWGDSTTRNLTSWRQLCTCDPKGLSSDPVFMSLVPGSENLSLTSSSPARGAGDGGTDLGAKGFGAGLPATSMPPPPSAPPSAPTFNSVKP